ncbi:acyloxyacyl hydrolase [Shewanella corallii]|uniref:Acyloxyacyl hydrolase n=1 Tax=Shewanella corallii TaxID=560080 RepID=A0ABT0N7U7_9GAMM|nr:acyloxyacyl hydrolase [Shewanella corallii]MCL2914170.1 acyloxyacyl hydrolase [Shewanella corallii]
MLKKIFVLSIGTLLAFDTFGFNETGISFSDGRPTEKQNKEIESWDIGVRHSPWTLGDDFAQIGMSARVGQLKLDDESAIRAGVGAFVAKNFGWVTFSLPIGVVWLEKTEFGSEQLRTKNYGGNLQFTYGAEMAWNVSSHWQMFYRYEHMSNGDRYEYNPALNSHNFGLRVNF